MHASSDWLMWLWVRMGLPQWWPLTSGWPQADKGAVDRWWFVWSLCSWGSVVLTVSICLRECETITQIGLSELLQIFLRPKVASFSRVCSRTNSLGNQVVVRVSFHLCGIIEQVGTTLCGITLNACPLFTFKLALVQFFQMWESNADLVFRNAMNEACWVWRKQ